MPTRDPAGPVASPGPPRVGRPPAPELGPARGDRPPARESAHRPPGCILPRRKGRSPGRVFWRRRRDALVFYLAPSTCLPRAGSQLDKKHIPRSHLIESLQTFALFAKLETPEMLCGLKPCPAESESLHLTLGSSRRQHPRVRRRRRVRATAES